MEKTLTLNRPARTESPAAALKDEERQPCEIWTRVMGYHRPVSSFNIGKRGEFHERLCFVEPKSCGIGG
jgi:hypothetical protein